MSKRYLMRVPTLIVIGVTGYAAYPLLPTGGHDSRPGSSAKPPPTARPSPSMAGLGRNPFLVDRPAGSPAGPSANSPAPTNQASKGAGPAALSKLAADEDRLLAEMRLGGIYIGGRDRIAIIDDRVYSRGEQLRKADGSPLPYVIADVRKDHALLRRGRRDFVLGFSNQPRAVVSKAGDSAPAKSSRPVDAPRPRPEASVPRKNASPSQRPVGKPTDPAGMIRQLLSSIVGTPSGGMTSGVGVTSLLGGSGASEALSGILEGASGTNAGASGVPINADTIQAGIDALSGKYDNIGRAGDPSGGSTP